MGLMSEYIKKGWKSKDFENELLRLIKEYNKIRSSYLLVYCSAIDKPIDTKIIMQEDYYIETVAKGFNPLLPLFGV